MSKEQIISASWVIPVVPENTVYENYAVHIRDGIIVDIAHRDELVNKHPDITYTHFANQLLMPGLVNTHGHAAMTLFRGMADDLALMDWLNNHIWPAEQQWVSEAFVKDGTQLAIAEMLLSGTTCFSDMYFFPEVIAETAYSAGIRVQACAPVLDFPTIWGSGPDEYIDKTCSLTQEWKSEDLVQIAFGPHAPYTLSDAPFKNIAEQALKLSAPVQCHVHETAFEVHDAVEKSGIRPLRRLKELGLLNQDISLQCVHMTQIDEQDIEDLQEANAHVLHCPESNLKLASGFCPIAKLSKAGINVALGTDGAASNNDLDLIAEMRTAALLAKGVAQDASAVDAHAAIRMATINGAKALGLDTKIGSLESGKSADMITIRCDHVSMIPMFNAASHVVYAANSRDVDQVWVNGKLLASDGQLMTIDKDACVETALAWRNKIQNTEIGS